MRSQLLLLLLLSCAAGEPRDRAGRALLPLCYPYRDAASQDKELSGRWSLSSVGIPSRCRRLKRTPWFCGDFRPPYGPRNYSARLTFWPDGCRLSPFDAAGLLGSLRNRHMLLVGDSLSMQVFVTLTCLLNGMRWTFWINKQTGLGRLDGGVQCHVYGDFNAKVCLARITRPDDFRKLCFGFDSECKKGPSGAPDQACCWRKLASGMLSQDDLLVLNLGLHVPRHIGERVLPLAGSALLNVSRSCGPAVLYREHSPQYFSTSDGGYRPEVQLTGPKMCSNVSNTFHGTERRLLPRGFPVLKFANTVSNFSAFPKPPPGEHPMASLRPNKRVDCTHWCLPGVPDHIVKLLYNYVRSEVWRPEFRGCGSAGTE